MRLALATRSLLIAQISDLHVRPAGHRYKKVVDSNAALVDAIDHLRYRDPAPLA